MDQILFAFYLLLTIPIGIVLGRFLHRSAPKAIKRLRKPHNWPKIIMITICVIIAMILLDFVTPIWGGQVRFYAKWVECGQRPQQESVKLGGHIEYHELSSAFSPLRDNHMQYFCTPREAELKGISGNQDSYSYPYLTEEEIRALP